MRFLLVGLRVVLPAGPSTLIVSGELVFLGCEESCRLDAPFFPEHRGHIAVAPRGRCSFASKASRAEAGGFSGLIIVNQIDSGAPFPPGLMPLTPTIPVVMVSAAAAYADTANTSVSAMVDSSGGPKILAEQLKAKRARLELSIPNEADLWEGSPWYRAAGGSSGTQSFLSDPAERWSVECDPTRAPLISDDAWLHRKWLRQLQEASESAGARGGNATTGSGCRELRSLEPRLTLATGAVRTLAGGAGIGAAGKIDGISTAALGSFLLDLSPATLPQLTDMTLGPVSGLYPA